MKVAPTATQPCQEMDGSEPPLISFAIARILSPSVTITEVDERFRLGIFALLPNIPTDFAILGVVDISGITKHSKRCQRNFEKMKICLNIYKHICTLKRLLMNYCTISTTENF